MSIKFSRKSIRLVLVAAIFASFLTGIIIISSTALNSSSQAYVSNGQISTSQSSSSLYPLPKSPAPASTLYVVGASGTMGYTVAAMQGIVARTQPQIFLTTNSQDKAWLTYLEQTYGIKSQSISSSQLLQQFKSYVTDSSGNVKIVIFDSNDALFPMQLNMATTLAGVYSALPVASSDLSTLQSIFGGKLNILYDLRGQFSSKVNGYSWLWNLVGSQVTKQFVAMAPEGRVPLTDYIVEFKAFDFEICCVSAGQHYTLTTAEQNFVNQVFSNYAPLTPVIGFFGLGGEVNTINYLSQHGYTATAGDGVSDLSVYSGFPDARSLSQVAENSISYSSSKIYVLWEITQGDALQYDFYNNYAEWTAIDPATNQPFRNEIPATWQINPIMAELAPPILQGWYSTQSALDDFITGPSGGAGYAHPDYMPNEAAQLAIAAKLDANVGINIHFDIFQSLSTSVYQNYIADTHPSAILLWQNSGRASQIVNGVPVMTSSFWEAAGYSYSSSDVSTAVSQIKNGGQFVYVIMNAQNPGFPFIQKVMNQLGSNYVPVSAQQYTDLYLKSMGVTTTSSSSSHSTTTTSSTTSSTTTHSTSSSSTTSHTTSSHTSSTSSSTSHTSHTTSQTTSDSTTTSATSSSDTSSSTYSTESSSSSPSTTSSESTSTVTTSSTSTDPSTSTTTSQSSATSSSTTSPTISTTTSYTSTTPSTSSTTQTSTTSYWSTTGTSYTTTTSASTQSCNDQWRGSYGVPVSHPGEGNNCDQRDGHPPVGSSGSIGGGSTAGSGNVVVRLGSEIFSGAIFAPSPQQPAGLVFGAFAAFGIYALGLKPMKSLTKRGEESAQTSDGWRW